MTHAWEQPHKNTNNHHFPFVIFLFSEPYRSVHQFNILYLTCIYLIVLTHKSHVPSFLKKKNANICLKRHMLRIINIIFFTFNDIRKLIFKMLNPRITRECFWNSKKIINLLCYKKKIYKFEENKITLGVKRRKKILCNKFFTKFHVVFNQDRPI
jgi:hypothetical protein